MLIRATAELVIPVYRYKVNYRHYLDSGVFAKEKRFKIANLLSYSTQLIKIKMENNLSLAAAEAPPAVRRVNSAELAIKPLFTN